MTYLYGICLTVGGLYSLLSFVLGNLIDFDFDFDFDLDGLSLPIKPVAIMAFLAVFGGAGLIALSYMHPALSLIPAVLAGALLSTALYQLVYVKLLKYEANAPKEADAVLQKAEVVERIAPGGYGKISFVLNGNILSGAAREKTPGKGIDKGKKVYIVEVRDSVYYVYEDPTLILKDLNTQ